METNKPRWRTGVYWKSKECSLKTVNHPLDFQLHNLKLLLPVELSCKSEYAILALIELAAHYQLAEPLQIRQIATKQNIPDRYLEQLLATLRRGGLVKSQRGSKGGYFLTREPGKITVFEVLACLEGLNRIHGCEEDKQPKTVESIIVEEVWQEARLAANSVLKKYTLADLCEQRNSHKQLDIMYYI